MSDKGGVEVISIADLAARRRERTAQSNPLTDPNVKTIARGVGTELRPQARTYNGVEIPDSSALYDEKRMLFGGQPVAEVLAKVTTDQQLPPATVREFSSTMEKRLLAARTAFININVRDANRRADEFRRLAEHAWAVAEDRKLDDLKGEVTRLLTDVFGPSRTGKILERMSAVTKIHQAHERNALKAKLGLIKGSKN